MRSMRLLLVAIVAFAGNHAGADSNAKGARGWVGVEFRAVTLEETHGQSLPAQAEA